MGCIAKVGFSSFKSPDLLELLAWRAGELGETEDKGDKENWGKSLATQASQTPKSSGSTRTVGTVII